MNKGIWEIGVALEHEAYASSDVTSFLVEYKPPRSTDSWRQAQVSVYFVAGEIGEEEPQVRFCVTVSNGSSRRKTKVSFDILKEAIAYAKKVVGEQPEEILSPRFVTMSDKSVVSIQATPQDTVKVHAFRSGSGESVALEMTPQEAIALAEDLRWFARAQEPNNWE